MEIDVIVAWSLALVPVLVLTAVFIWLDVFKLVTFWETIVLLLLGGAVAAIAYPISGVFLDTLPIGFNNYSRFVAPWLEEALKTIVIISLFQFNRIGLKLDAVIMGFAVGAGFSVVENIFYLLRFEDLPPSVWMVRGLGTAIMHGTTCAILAAIAHQLAERNMHSSARDYHFSPLWFVPGFLAAVAIHTTFNQFPRQPIVAMLGTVVLAPLSLLAIFRFGTREAEQWLTEEEEAHEALVDTLHAGSFPDDPGWRRVAALAERSGAQAQAMIREYVTILTELVLTEELALLHKTADAAGSETGIGARFDRLAELRRSLGKTTLSAVTSLLPFSRADYWELWELHRHVKGGTHAEGATKAE
ncbi:MAG TPA: PrsW family glutamic-type intramembrane protease [Sphingomicrobium sp.]|jgi:RsiW-degrading membrane proteinase PrsW (M82 family)|nr:PrsW family glutamic-type intramembrane protease [Sphingomicrobium sp.]